MENGGKKKKKFGIMKKEYYNIPYTSRKQNNIKYKEKKKSENQNIQKVSCT